jgi:hypothetical protein
VTFFWTTAHGIGLSAHSRPLCLPLISVAPRAGSNSAISRTPGSNLVASFMGSRRDSTRRDSSPGGSGVGYKQTLEFGSVYVYKTLLVFCNLQAKEKQEVIDRDSKLLMAQCIPVRWFAGSNPLCGSSLAPVGSSIPKMHFFSTCTLLTCA